MSATHDTAVPARRWRRRGVVTAKCLLSAGLLVWLVTSGRLDFNAYRQLGSGPNLALLSAVVLVQAAAFALFIDRWWGLSRAQGIPITRGEVFRTGLKGLFTQLFLPGGIGADGVRILHVRKHYRDQLVRGISSLITDRITGLVGLVLLGVVATAAYQLTSGNRHLVPLLSFFVVLLAGGAAALLGLWFAARLPQLTRFWQRDLPARALDALRAYRSNRSAVTGAVGISIVGHLITAVACYLAVVALGDRPSMIGVLAITTALNLIRMIPITPLGLGVADGAAEVLYAQIGLSNGAELQMLTRVVSVLLFTGAGLAFLFEPAAASDA